MKEKNEIHLSTFDILGDAEINSSYSKNIELKNDLDEKMLMENYVNVLEQPIEYKKEIIKNAKRKVWNIVRKIKQNDYYKYYNLIQDKWYIINPANGHFKFYFNIIYYFIFYIDIIITPLELSYEFKNYIIREIYFDIFFIFDFSLNFITAFYDYNMKHYITDFREIFIHYLKNGFPFDLLTVFPFYLFNKKLSIFRLIKLYRYTTFNDKLKKYLSLCFKLCINKTIIVRNIVRVISFFLSLCYILHVCACVYIYLGINYGHSWIYYHKDSLDPKNPFEIYINSVYFLTETFSTTGYGDLTPNLLNEYELFFIICCQIINCCLFSYLISNILDIFTNKENSLKNKYRIEELNLQKWIKYYMKRLPASSKKTNIHRDKIWNDVKRYFEIYYSIERNFSWISQYSLINEMKPIQKNLLFEKVFSNFYNQFEKFFKNFLIKKTKHDIILNLKTNIETSDTVLINKGEKIKKLYFLEQGEIFILATEKINYSNKDIIKVLRKGDFFGIEGLIPNNNDRISNYKYIVPKDREFIVFYTINLDFLLEEILSYDGESYNILITLAKYYKLEILNQSLPDDEIRKIDYNIDKLGIYPTLLDKIEINKKYNDLLKNMNSKIENIKKNINELNVIYNKLNVKKN